MLSAHSLPFFAARKLGGELSHAYAHGMVGNTFDSLTGQWATQGPNLYVLGRFHTRPDWPVEKILDEYSDGFGPAAKAVRAYFGYWEKVSEQFSDEKSIKKHGRLAYRKWWDLALRMYPPEAMAGGRKLLTDAHEAAQGDPVAGRRVEFLEKGLTHAKLTMDVTFAHADHQENSGDPISDPYTDNYTGKLGARYKSALDRLVEFRKVTALECPNFANVGWMTFQEWAVLWAHLKPWDPKTPGRYRSSPPGGG